MTITRRIFLSTGFAASLGAPAVLAQGHGKPRVVVIGGGAGGATAARHLVKDSNGAINVSLIAPSRRYYTCFFSNHCLGGFKKIEDLSHGYDKLAAAGVNVVHDWAIGVDRNAKRVSFANGNTLPYDKLILSPGIDFVPNAVEGWSLSTQNAMPHAYTEGIQIQRLKAQIKAMPQGGVFAMVAPPNPYRCPPAPYERASMVAHYLKAHNPTAKIIIADPKPTFTNQSLFEEGWGDHYVGMIDWIGEDFGGANVSVDPDAMTLSIDGEQMKVDVCNVIPAMQAGGIAVLSGVVDGRWAPVNPHDMSSTIDPDLYVLGDAAHQGDMPKSAFAANSQAKACATAVRAALTGSKTISPKFASTCWSLISAENSIKVGATYEATARKISKTTGFMSSIGESNALRHTTYAESEAWYRRITMDMFG